MRVFIFKSLVVFMGISALLFALILLLANGRIDPYYLRFTTPRQTSLIVGSSRAAQDIIPDRINKTSDVSIFNFAFSLLNSPYGPIYYHAICEKLDTTSRQGVFIVEVSPMALSYRFKTNPGDKTEQYREKDGFLDKLYCFNVKPNLDYITRCYKKHYINFIINNIRKGPLELHNNGWLEVSVPMDSAHWHTRKENKLQEVFRKMSGLRYSERRERWLGKTVHYLSQYGKVILVRLPTGKEIAGMEEKRYPDFDKRMRRLADQFHISYLNLIMQSGAFRTTDGHHLWKEDALKVSDTISLALESGKE